MQYPYLARPHPDRFTFDLRPGQRELLFALAEAQGLSAGECLRRILAEMFTRLQEEQG